ncbi:tetratricopeptide repeat-containing sulfotransferase family protein [Sphingomonas edaphi]|uniref:Sulfotransferase family protein n=1 Tax=Sphingomonas edaphi TaxID=2315689 RepID=A0A418PYA3_9SPHN|nr:tetratricopeptide repeat-containing sulfotransferase family protein [Sphingomonas edaphi]RIX26991.1 sulfotransferase family protein [Sphingomonas edaphi]
MTTSPSTTQARPGSYEEGLQNGYRLLDRDPASAIKQAEALVRTAKDPRAFRLAAAALRKLGHQSEAEGAELGAIEAGFADPRLKAIAEAEADGRSNDALVQAQSALNRQPDDLLALTLAAESLLSLWRTEEAEAALRTVLGRAPGYLRASMLLAHCVERQVKPRNAIAVVDEILKRKPDNQAALRLAVTSRAEVNDHEEVVKISEKLTALEPENVGYWVHLGHHYRIVGRRADAIRAFRRAIALDEYNGSAWWSLANYFRDGLAQEDAETIERGISAGGGTLDEGNLRLASGIIAERSGDLERAAQQFIAGKKIRLEAQPYDPELVGQAVSGLIKVLTPGLVSQRSQAGYKDPAPIFVLGMPRAGTTLVERILGRHDEIEGVGELSILNRLAEIARRRTTMKDEFAALITEISDENLHWVGQRYIEASRDYRKTTKPHYIDKANLNWIHAGLILMALPGAKIIDVRRNALDCCWANFKMLFADRYPATNDLRHIARFYRDYVRLLDTLAAIAPGRILQVRYEDVVDDIEGQTRRMLEFLGLQFDPRCVDFHLATDAVATASSEQVRKPLNREGIGSAEPYRQWLGPMIEELGELAGR